MLHVCFSRLLDLQSQLTGFFPKPRFLFQIYKLWHKIVFICVLKCFETSEKCDCHCFIDRFASFQMSLKMISKYWSYLHLLFLLSLSIPPMCLFLSSSLFLFCGSFSIEALTLFFYLSYIHCVFVFVLFLAIVIKQGYLTLDLNIT